PGRGVYLVNIIDIYPRAQYPEPRGTASGNPEVAQLSKLPETLLPDETSPVGYVSCRAPFERLLVMRREGAGLSLACRGVMQDEFRAKLLQQAAGDERYQEAIQVLYKR